MNTQTMSFPRSPIAVALDAPTCADAQMWAVEVAPEVSCLKVGLEVFCRDGRDAVAAARAGANEVGCSDTLLFLDLKLHDIPATVAGAARALRDISPDFLTVHASGGADMIAAACTALPETRITAVTVLTSLTEEDLVVLGIAGSPQDVVVRWALIAVAAGARAIVCSPQEVAAVRAAVPRDVVLITPGVRPVGTDAHDQKRVMAPREAIESGADLLVIGRPITGAPDRRAAAAAISKSLLSTGFVA